MPIDLRVLEGVILGVGLCLFASGVSVALLHRYLGPFSKSGRPSRTDRLLGLCQVVDALVAFALILGFEQQSTAIFILTGLLAATAFWLQWQAWRVSKLAQPGETRL